MLEALIIISLVYAFMLFPLRGKTVEQLNEKQLKTLERNFESYKRSRKADPNMTKENYLPILQKQAVKYLILALCLIPVYILIIVFIYPTLFV